MVGVCTTVDSNTTATHCTFENGTAVQQTFKCCQLDFPSGLTEISYEQCKVRERDLRVSCRGYKDYISFAIGMFLSSTNNETVRVIPI